MPASYTKERLIWRGREFRVTDLRWGQEFSGGLPETVAATNGSSTWRGSCSIAHDSHVSSGGVNPWSDGHPKPGDELVIEVYVDDALVATYRPIVDEVSFSLSKASIDFIMPVDSFSNTLRLPPVMQTTPQTVNPWGKELFGVRYPAPTPLWPVSEAFRAAGYHLTPPIDRSTMVDISMQGAVWANQWRRLGEVVEVGKYGESAVAYPRMYGANGILWMHHGVVYVGNNSSIDSSSGFRVSFLVNPNSKGRIDITAVASPDYLGLIIDEKRNITLFQKLNDKQLLHIPSIDWDGRSEVTIIYKPGFVTVHAGEVTRKAPTDFSGVFTGVRARVEENGGIAGLQVDSLLHDDRYRIKGFKPSARIIGGMFTSYVRTCLPSVRDKSAREVLDEVASATLASWWVDGDGIANFEDADSIARRPVSHTIASANIGSYTIASDLLNTGSSVEVRYSECTRSASNGHTINLWSKGGTATAGTYSETFASPDDDTEEWIDPDFTFESINAWVDGFNSRNGSWWGACKNGAKYDAPTVWASGYRFSSTQVTPWTVKISEIVSEDCSRSVYEHPQIWRSLRGADTPILRGRGLVTRKDEVVSVSGGRKAAPVVKIDGRKWIDRRDRAEAISLYLINLLSSPPPTLRSIKIPYNPSIILGQSVTVSGYSPNGSDFLFGAELGCNVIGFEHSPDDGETSLSLRVIAVTSTVRTWREVEAAVRHAGITWETAERRIVENGVTWELFGKSALHDGG